jgi:ribosome-binding factor A
VYQQTERTRRVSELIKREIADILLRDVDRSDLRLVSVTAVTVSRDLRNATVFFTVLGNDDAAEEVAHELNELKGFVRKQLASRVRLKRLPDLLFRFDDSIGRGMKLSQLIDSVKPKDSTDQGQ